MYAVTQSQNTEYWYGSSYWSHKFEEVNREANNGGPSVWKQLQFDRDAYKRTVNFITYRTGSLLRLFW